MALLPGPFPVAVAATNLALLNFGKQSIHPPAKSGDAVSNVAFLGGWIDMIELKNDWIGLAAVDARM